MDFVLDSGSVVVSSGVLENVIYMHQGLLITRQPITTVLQCWTHKNYVDIYKGEWVHYALCRKDGVIKIYLNGTYVGVPTTGTDTKSFAAQYYMLGYTVQSPSNACAHMMMDDVCIVKGLSVWEENFVPPQRFLYDYIYGHRLYNDTYNNFYGILKQ